MDPDTFTVIGAPFSPSFDKTDMPVKYINMDYIIVTSGCVVVFGAVVNFCRGAAVVAATSGDDFSLTPVCTSTGGVCIFIRLVLVESCWGG